MPASLEARHSPSLCVAAALSAAAALLAVEVWADAAPVNKAVVSNAAARYLVMFSSVELF
jgi:hypothetical protein